MSAFSFGSYIPLSTPVHRVDPRVKFALMVAITFGALASDTWLTLALLGAALVIFYLVARIPLGRALRGLLPVGLILFVTVLFNALSLSPVPDGTLLLGPLSFTPSGCLAGLKYAARMLVTVCAASVLTFTTSPLELSDGLGRLLGPLRKLKVPVDDIALVVSIVLRFIPLIADEAYAIRDAQASRGAVFGKGGPYRRIKAWVPVVIPLVVRLFRHADDLARTLDARCYGSAKRTVRSALAMRGADWGILVIGCVVAMFLGVFF